SADEAFVSDSLNVKNMNINPGGKQWCLHSTQIPFNNPPPAPGQVQSIVYPADHPDPKLCGTLKGIKAVLKERTSESSSNTCCMTQALAQQQDFLNEKPQIQTFIERKGHICIFLPKFHCEHNPIEMYWEWTK
ncbi:hypothetical protein M422DRAFT_136398, partial [Sphaerobolus stellatus SS14]